jgi:hypothetical protein
MFDQRSFSYHFFGALVGSAIEKLKRVAAGEGETSDAGNGFRYVRITVAV